MIHKKHKNFQKVPNKLTVIIILLIMLAIVVEVFILGGTKGSTLQNILVNKSISKENCKAVSGGTNKQQCWEDLLDATLKEKGIKDAFLIFDDLYKNEPQFVADCHGFTHKLGEAAYKLLIEGKDLDFPPQTAYCGYGFYHGLTELLLQTKGVKEASRLCDSKKSQITQVLYDACYHGIGHGALSSTARDKNIWGDAQKMINSALNLCREATDDSTEQSRCASGVFMELGNNYGQLNLTPNKDDPLSICRAQQEFGKMDCYTQMNGVLNSIAGGKLKEAAKFVEDIDEDKYAIEAMITVAAPDIDITKKDHTDDIIICRSLQERLHLPCIKGLVLGFMLKGQPGIEYEQAINFCKSTILSEDEKQSCFDLLLKHSSEMYPSDTLGIICQKVDSRYKKNYCPNN